MLSGPALLRFRRIMYHAINPPMSPSPTTPPTTPPAMAPVLDLEPDVEPEPVPEGGAEPEADDPDEDCEEEGTLLTVGIGTAVDSGLSPTARAATAVHVPVMVTFK